MKLPNGGQAIVDRRKLTGYVLNAAHEVGGPKARVFGSVFGLTADRADILERALLEAAASSFGAVTQGVDQYGERFRLDFVLEVHGVKRVVRSGWLVRGSETPPEFMSAWVLRANAAGS